MQPTARVGTAAADQQHGRIARTIDIGQRGRPGPFIRKPAQHGCVQGTDSQRGVKARCEAIGVSQRERNGVLRQQAGRINHDQGEVRFSPRDLPCQQLQAPSSLPIGEDGRRLNVRHGRRRIGPSSVNNRKHPRFLERIGKRRASAIRDDEDRTLLGHLTTGASKSFRSG